MGEFSCFRNRTREIKTDCGFAVAKSNLSRKYQICRSTWTWIEPGQTSHDSSSSYGTNVGPEFAEKEEIATPVLPSTSLSLRLLRLIIYTAGYALRLFTCLRRSFCYPLTNRKFTVYFIKSCNVCRKLIVEKMECRHLDPWNVRKDP